LENIDGCVVISLFLKNSLVKTMPWLEGKTHVIKHGIDINLYMESHKYSKNKLRKELGLPVNGKLIFIAGRLMKEKGQDTAIDFFKVIVHKIDNVSLVIAGNGPDYSYLKKKVTDSSEIEDKVYFVGSINQRQMPLYYRAADLFLQLSRIPTESFGLVYIEANACLVPVVGFNVGGVGESIENGVSGILIDLNDVSAANKIAGLLLDEKKCAYMAQSGLKRVVQHFSLEVMAVNTERILSHSLGKKKI